jgi:hypothetical protein
MTLLVLLSALPKPKLTDEEAIAIVNYHLTRNRTARNSHTKAWHLRHQNVPYKMLL